MSVMNSAKVGDLWIHQGLCCNVSCSFLSHMEYVFYFQHVFRCSLQFAVLISIHLSFWRKFLFRLPYSHVKKCTPSVKSGLFIRRHYKLNLVTYQILKLLKSHLKSENCSRQPCLLWKNIFGLLNYEGSTFWLKY